MACYASKDFRYYIIAVPFFNFYPHYCFQSKNVVESLHLDNAFMTRSERRSCAATSAKSTNGVAPDARVRDCELWLPLDWRTPDGKSAKLGVHRRCCVLFICFTSSHFTPVFVDCAGALGGVAICVRVGCEKLSSGSQWPGRGLYLCVCFSSSLLSVFRRSVTQTHRPTFLVVKYGSYSKERLDHRHRFCLTQSTVSCL